MLQDQQNYYWLFSSSAQTISAFVAFLITGYAIVLSIMNDLEQKDETLEDIHNELKKEYYGRIRILLIITGIAIISSLGMVIINGGLFQFKIWFYLFTILINIATIIFGIYFVLSVIDPNRYKKAVQVIINEDNMESSSQTNDIDVSTFIKEFITIEKNIRTIFGSQVAIFIPPNIKDGTKQMSSYSFRDIITMLFYNDIINNESYDNLLRINKYRNLVVHGKLDKVDVSILENLINESANISKIKEKNEQKK